MSWLCFPSHAWFVVGEISRKDNQQSYVKKEGRGGVYYSAYLVLPHSKASSSVIGAKPRMGHTLLLQLLLLLLLSAVPETTL